jgi:hypothetical protein
VSKGADIAVIHVCHSSDCTTRAKCEAHAVIAVAARGVKGG